MLLSSQNLALQKNSLLEIKRQKSKDRIKVIVIFILFVLLGSIGILLVVKFQKENKQNSQTENTDHTEVSVNSTTDEKMIKAEAVLEKLKTIYEIPEDESPTVISITDVEALKIKDPVFYKNARNGDKIIILFTKKIAIVFREEEVKIINVAPVELDS